MFPVPHSRKSGTPRFPRVRGDVPHWIGVIIKHALFSPRTRGCSDLVGVGFELFFVFPAYAGMFRIGSVLSLNMLCFPRVRGDVPTW